MEITELESIFDDILDRSERLVREGIRLYLRNERVFHHIFSSLVASHFLKKGVDVWQSLLLLPECPTQETFSWKHMKLSDAKHTRKYGVGKGKRGQFDFAILTEPPIFVEWKGPNVYGTKDVAEVMLKLLSQDQSHLKVFAAIMTSSRTGRRDHMDAIRERLEKGLEFALQVLDINNLGDRNLHIYVATITNECARIRWGHCARIKGEFV